jgi:ABC-2 type transport system ATP-binding protein
MSLSERSAATVGTAAVAAASPVTLSGVSVFYGEVIGLSNVTFDVRPGITGLVGPNGSGKSTLMRVVTGLIQPREGEALVLGQRPFENADVRCKMTFVPSTENFHTSLSGRQHLEVAFVAQGRDRADAKALASRALDTIRLTEDGDRRYGNWSRGMRQRLKLGIALVSDTPLVLLDEPFLGVDPPNRVHLRELIQSLAAAGRAVLVSSHVLHEVEALTSRVGVIANGRMLGFGEVHQLLRQLRDQHPHRIMIHVDNPRPVAIALLHRAHIRELKIIGADGVEFVTDEPEAAYRELAEAVVETGEAIRRVDTLDNSLEAVFEHVTSAGTRRL